MSWLSLILGGVAGWMAWGALSDGRGGARTQLRYKLELAEMNWDIVYQEEDNIAGAEAAAAQAYDAMMLAEALGDKKAEQKARRLYRLATGAMYAEQAARMEAESIVE